MGDELRVVEGAAQKASESESQGIWHTPAVAVAAAAVLALFVIVRGIGPGTTPMEVGPQRVQASVAITLPEVPGSSESQAEQKTSRASYAERRTAASFRRQVPAERTSPDPMESALARAEARTTTSLEQEIRQLQGRVFHESLRSSAESSLVSDGWVQPVRLGSEWSRPGDPARLAESRRDSRPVERRPGRQPALRPSAARIVAAPRSLPTSCSRDPESGFRLATRDPLREERGRQHRLPGRRRRPDRPRLRARLGLAPRVRLGGAPDRAATYGGWPSFSRLILFDKRGTGPLRPGAAAAAHPRGADGRRAGGDGRGRLGAGRPLRALRGRRRCACSSPPPTRSGPRRSSSTATYAKRVWAPDYPWAPTPEERRAVARTLVEQEWGGAVDLSTLGAERCADEPAFARWWARYLRLSASPRPRSRSGA